MMPQSNTDSKVFALAVTTGSNQSGTSKANTITTVTNATSSHTASNPFKLTRIFIISMYWYFIFYVRRKVNK